MLRAHSLFLVGLRPEARRAGAGDRVAVLVPLRVLSLRFHCGRVASLGGLLCAERRCMSGLCFRPAGPLCERWSGPAGDLGMVAALAAGQLLESRASPPRREWLCGTEAGGEAGCSR